MYKTCYCRTKLQLYRIYYTLSQKDLKPHKETEPVADCNGDGVDATGIKTVASAPSVSGLVFMQRFKLLLGQCEALFCRLKRVPSVQPYSIAFASAQVLTWQIAAQSDCISFRFATSYYQLLNRDSVTWFFTLQVWFIFTFPSQFRTCTNAQLHMLSWFATAVVRYLLPDT